MESNTLLYLPSRYSCLNTLNIPNIPNNSNISCYHWLALIVISHPLFVDSHNAITRASNQSLPINIQVVILVMTLFSNMYHVNLTNQIYRIKAISNRIKKGYISLKIINLTYILKAFIRPCIRMPNKVNTSVKTLMKWMQILLILRSYVKNIKVTFFKILALQAFEK